MDANYSQCNNWQKCIDGTGHVSLWERIVLSLRKPSQPLNDIRFQSGWYEIRKRVCSHTERTSNQLIIIFSVCCDTNIWYNNNCSLKYKILFLLSGLLQNMHSVIFKPKFNVSWRKTGKKVCYVSLPVCVIHISKSILNGCVPAQWSVCILSMIECMIKRKLQTCVWLRYKLKQDIQWRRRRQNQTYDHMTHYMSLPNLL